MKRSTGLYLILLPFMWLILQMVSPISLIEGLILFGVLNVGCKGLVRD